MRWLYYSDIIVAFFSIDTLNVIYRTHMLILLVCLPQIYVHSSSYTLLITGNSLKNNNDGNFLQKSSAKKTKIAAIFHFNAMRVCKTQFHWSSQMEWLWINQSAFRIQTAWSVTWDHGRTHEACHKDRKCSFSPDHAKFFQTET